jgi:hypothetical protein
MHPRRILGRIALPALALALLLPNLAHAADQTGAEGRAQSIQINAQSSDAFLQFHGRLFVKSGNSTVEYRWGGTSCGSRTLTDNLVAQLTDAVRDKNGLIVPLFQNGQGSSKCLVGFTIKEPSPPSSPKPSNKRK